MYNDTNFKKFYIRLPDSPFTTMHKEFVYFKVVYEGRSFQTAQWFTGVFKRYADWLKDNYYELTVESFTEDTVKKFLMYGTTECHWKRNSLLNYIKALKSFADWLVSEKKITINPFDNIKRPRQEFSMPVFLTKDEARHLMNYLSTRKWFYNFERYRNMAIFATFLYTGIRLAELLNLKTDDIDLNAGTLRINKGKMQKDRILPINDRLKKLLFDYYKDRQRLMRNCEYFFVSSNRDLPLTRDGLKKLVAGIDKECGLKKHISPHILRHTAATLLLEATSDLDSVRNMLGHTTLAMSLRYSHASVTHLHKQMAKIEI
jgi:site-specific recombinase XerD